MNDYYVYGCFEPNKDEPFYIGKGRGNRIQEHLTECYRNKKTHFYRKLKSMLDKGIQPKFVFFHINLSNQEAIELEIALINSYGRLDLGTGCLTNHTNGGDGSNGYKHTEEAKQLMSIQRKGRKHTEETKERMKESWKDRIISDEQIQESKDRMLGNTLGVGNRGPLGNTNFYGATHSIDSKIKMSQSQLKVPKEIRNKIKLIQRLNRGHMICSYNFKTNETIKIYLSINQVKENGFCIKTIQNILKNDYPNYTGVGWRYLTIEEKQEFINNLNIK